MGEKTSGLNWAEKIIIGTSSLTVTLDFTALGPILPKMRDVFAHYPDADFLVKMLVGVIGASMVIGCPIGGWLAKRFNHRLLMAWPLALYAVSGGFGLVVSDLYVLLATRFVIGFSAAVASTVALVMLSALAQGHTRNVWMGVIISVGMIIGVISYPLAGFLGDISWRLPYALYLITLPLAAICFFFVRDAYKTEAEAPVVVQAPAHQSIPYRIMFLALINGHVSFIPPVYVPFHLHEIGIKEPSLISAVLTTPTVIGAVFSSLYGRMR